MLLVRKWPDWPGLRVSQRSRGDLEPPVEAPSGSRARLRRPTVVVRELARNIIRHSQFLSLSKSVKRKAQLGIAQKGNT